jgi:hypothetical protein
MKRANIISEFGTTRLVIQKHVMMIQGRDIGSVDDILCIYTSRILVMMSTDTHYM